MSLMEFEERLYRWLGVGDLGSELEGSYVFSEEEAVLTLKREPLALHTTYGEGVWQSHRQHIFVHFPYKGLELIGRVEQVAAEGQALTRVQGKVYRSPTPEAAGLELWDFSLIKFG